jgi:hypothetical protein
VRPPFDFERLGPLYQPLRHPDVKDPCIVFDGARWHLFGTGCGLTSGLEILHCTAHSVDGPWYEEPPSVLRGADHIADHAGPGVIAEGTTLHMFLQQSFNRLGSAVEHLVSVDGGHTFWAVDMALPPVPGTREASLYDPDPAAFDGEKYLTYAAFSTVGQPDLYLARSTSGTWDGPWDRLGCILHHEQVEYHNPLGSDDYEWGLEGPQLIQLPDGRALLTAVCFLADRPRGQRQRVLLAIADDVVGPYQLIGPVLEPCSTDGAGENGHGTAIVHGDELRVVYQERSGIGQPWRIMSARAHLGDGSAADGAAA